MLGLFRLFWKWKKEYRQCMHLDNQFLPRPCGVLSCWVKTDFWTSFIDSFSAAVHCPGFIIVSQMQQNTPKKIGFTPVVIQWLVERKVVQNSHNLLSFFSKSIVPYQAEFRIHAQEEKTNLTLKVNHKTQQNNSTGFEMLWWNWPFFLLISSRGVKFNTGQDWHKTVPAQDSSRSFPEMERKNNRWQI